MWYTANNKAMSPDRASKSEMARRSGNEGTNNMLATKSLRTKQSTCQGMRSRCFKMTVWLYGFIRIYALEFRVSLCECFMEPAPVKREELIGFVGGSAWGSRGWGLTLFIFGGVGGKQWI